MELEIDERAARTFVSHWNELVDALQARIADRRRDVEAVLEHCLERREIRLLVAPPATLTCWHVSPLAFAGSSPRAIANAMIASWERQHRRFPDID